MVRFGDVLFVGVELLSGLVDNGGPRGSRHRHLVRGAALVDEGRPLGDLGVDVLGLFGEASWSAGDSSHPRTTSILRSSSSSTNNSHSSTSRDRIRSVGV